MPGTRATFTAVKELLAAALLPTTRTLALGLPQALNNIYAGKDGDVYRYNPQTGNWSQNAGNGWKSRLQIFSKSAAATTGTVCGAAAHPELQGLHGRRNRGGGGREEGSELSPGGVCLSETGFLVGVLLLQRWFKAIEVLTIHDLPTEILEHIRIKVATGESLGNNS